MTPGEQVVQAAMAYAEAAGEGTGYWLKIGLVDGVTLRGNCYMPKDGVMRMEIVNDDHGVNYAEPVWVNLSMVSHVQIEW